MAGNIWFTWDRLWIFAYAVVSRLVIFGLLLSTEAEKNRTVSLHVQQNKNSSLKKQQFYQPFCNETRAWAILISVEWWHWSKVSLLPGTLVHVHDMQQPHNLFSCFASAHSVTKSEFKTTNLSYNRRFRSNMLCKKDFPVWLINFKFAPQWFDCLCQLRWFGN